MKNTGFLIVIFLFASTLIVSAQSSTNSFFGTTQLSDTELTRLFGSGETGGSTKARFLRGLRSYLGVPYVYGGINKNGIDCSGLLYTVSLEATGLPLPRTSAAMCRKFTPIKKSSLQPGDAIFFTTDGTINVSHVGVYLGDNYFIHAQSFGDKTGVVISNLNAKYWQQTYYSSARIFE